MLDQVNATPTPHKGLPWNKGKLTGAKANVRIGSNREELTASKCLPGYP